MKGIGRRKARTGGGTDIGTSERRGIEKGKPLRFSSLGKTKFGEKLSNLLVHHAKCVSSSLVYISLFRKVARQEAGKDVQELKGRKAADVNWLLEHVGGRPPPILIIVAVGTVVAVVEQNWGRFWGGYGCVGGGLGVHQLEHRGACVVVDRRALRLLALESPGLGAVKGLVAAPIANVTRVIVDTFASPVAAFAACQASATTNALCSESFPKTGHCLISLFDSV